MTPLVGPKRVDLWPLEKSLSAVTQSAGTQSTGTVKVSRWVPSHDVGYSTLSGDASSSVALLSLAHKGVVAGQVKAGGFDFIRCPIIYRLRESVVNQTVAVGVVE